MGRRPVGLSASILVVLALSCAAGAQELLEDRGDGTVLDRGTGLVWVADPAFAVSSGFAADPWMTPAQAAALVRAMNTGAIEGFGRTDWRVPSAREVATFEGRADGGRRVVTASRTGPAVGTRVRPVAGAAVVAGVAEAAVIVTNSLRFDHHATVAGDVVANEASGGPTLHDDYEVKIDRDAVITGDVAGDSVHLGKNAAVAGTVAYNDLSTASGVTTGGTSTPLPLPVFSLLPVFRTAAPRAGAADVSVGSGESLTLAAGDYGAVTIAAGGSLELAGGVYEIDALAIGDHGLLTYAAAVDVRVAGRVSVDAFSEVGPAAGSGLDGSAAILYVGGVNGTDGLLGSTPYAVEVDRDCSLTANLYAPNGTVKLDHHTSVVGGVITRDLDADRNVTITAASAFGNQPPVADPGLVYTAGPGAVTFELRGSDPEGEDLAFSVAVPPQHGALSSPVAIVPPVEVNPETGQPVQAPVTRATITYTPAGGGDVEDSFVFRVTDPPGASGVAEVTVNPPASETPPPPPPTTVVVEDFLARTRQDSTLSVIVLGDAPDGVDLTFSVLAGTGPDHGVLGPLSQGTEVPRRSASTTYTPDPGFVGTDGFAFQACGTIAGALTCDQAQFTFDVFAPPVEAGELAEDREFHSFNDQSVAIDLSAPPGVVSGPAVGGPAVTALASRRVVARAVGVQGAAIAGNVADAGGDGLGDNHNALPGPGPGLISAGVDQAGGPGSNGAVRIHVEWDVSALAGIQDDLVGATVQVTTNRGTVDSLDTFFWSVSEEGDGVLEDADFERSAETLAGAVMVVPPLVDQAVGEDGSYSFDVLAELVAALDAGRGYFTVQGRVDEDLTGPARGLQVYSTADGNLPAGRHPQLTFSTPPPVLGLVFTITVLPQFGTLFDSLGQPITGAPTTLQDPRINYVPASGFVGSDSFRYEVTDFSVTDEGLVTLVVEQGTCEDDEIFCDDGR